MMYVVKHIFNVRAEVANMAARMTTILKIKDMRNLTINGTYYGEVITIEQIQKGDARKLFQAGETIYMQSSNLPPLGVLTQCVDINNKNGEIFDFVVNSFEHYNCNSVYGKYAVFYKRIKR